MTREEILDYFKDINAMYNDCTKYDTLKRMLDELQDPYEDAKKYFDTIYSISQTYDLSYGFVKDEIEEIMKRCKGLRKQTFEGMTNGEVMKALFPKIEVKEFSGDGTIEVFGIDVCKFEGVLMSEEWWNAPYKGSEQN